MLPFGFDVQFVRLTFSLVRTTSLSTQTHSGWFHSASFSPRPFPFRRGYITFSLEAVSGFSAFNLIVSPYIGCLLSV